MSIVWIDDVADPRLADYRNVPDPELLTRRGLFIAEGRLVVRRLLTRSALRARSVMVTAAARRALDDVFAASDTLPIYEVPQQVMDDITGFNIHRGCLAVGERPAPRPWRELVEHAPASARLVALERVGNADNVGSIFRNASAFGLHAVLLGPSCADPLYRKAIRTSMGAALTMPFAVAEPWPAAIAELRATGWATVALTPRADGTLLADCAATLASRRTIFVVGHEGDGLTPEALAVCESCGRIPMAAGVDSISVATAAAIAFYESRRPVS